MAWEFCEWCRQKIHGGALTRGAHRLVCKKRPKF